MPDDPDPQDEQDRALPAPDPVKKALVDDLPDDDPTFRELARLRDRQRRDAARGCLLALVLQTAAVLAAVVWVVARSAGMGGLAQAGAFAFVAFTIAAVVAAVFLLVVQNLPRHRRLRAEADEAERP